MEGNFRLTCEAVMKVLRYHKDSLMAVLEVRSPRHPYPWQPIDRVPLAQAFVYDPLINWRLLTTESAANTSTGTLNPLPPQAAAGLGEPPLALHNVVGSVSSLWGSSAGSAQGAKQRELFVEDFVSLALAPSPPLVPSLIYLSPSTALPLLLSSLLTPSLPPSQRAR